MKPTEASLVLRALLAARHKELLFSQREALKTAIAALDENTILREKYEASHAAATSNKNLLDIAWKRIEELEENRQ